MHDHDQHLVNLALAVARHELTTVKPLRSPASAATIYGALAGSISAAGIGADATTMPAGLLPQSADFPD